MVNPYHSSGNSEDLTGAVEPVSQIVARVLTFGYSFLILCGCHLSWLLTAWDRGRLRTLYAMESVRSDSPFIAGVVVVTWVLVLGAFVMIPVGAWVAIHFPFGVTRADRMPSGSVAASLLLYLFLLLGALALAIFDPLGAMDWFIVTT